MFCERREEPTGGSGVTTVQCRENSAAPGRTSSCCLGRIFKINIQIGKHFALGMNKGNTDSDFWVHHIHNVQNIISVMDFAHQRIQIYTLWSYDIQKDRNNLAFSRLMRVDTIFWVRSRELYFRFDHISSARVCVRAPPLYTPGRIWTQCSHLQYWWQASEKEMWRFMEGCMQGFLHTIQTSHVNEMRGLPLTIFLNDTVEFWVPPPPATDSSPAPPDGCGRCIDRCAWCRFSVPSEAAKTASFQSKVPREAAQPQPGWHRCATVLGSSVKIDRYHFS